MTTTWNATYAERTFSYLKTYTGHSATGTAASCTVTRTVWYDERNSVILRAHLAGTYHLGGIATWTAGGEDPGQWPLLRSYAQTIAPSATFTRASVAPAHVTYGQAVTVYGLATAGNGGTPIAGASVQLQAQRVGASRWNTLATGTTADDGTVQLCHIPAGPTNYRLLTLAAFDHTAAYSAVATVTVSRHVTLVPSATQVVHGTTIRYSGVVAPSGSGIRVYVQHWTGATYVTTGSVVAGTGGAFYFPVSGQGRRARTPIASSCTPTRRTEPSRPVRSPSSPPSRGRPPGRSNQRRCSKSARDAVAAASVGRAAAAARRTARAPRPGSRPGPTPAPVVVRAGSAARPSASYVSWASRSGGSTGPVAVPPQPGRRVEAVVRQQPPAVVGDQRDRLDDVVEHGLGDEVVEVDPHPAGLDALAAAR